MKKFKDFIKRKIVCDVDGVLLKFHSAFLSWVKKNKIPLKLNFTKYDFNVGAGKIFPYIKDFWDSGMMDKLEFFNGAEINFNKLAANNEMIIVTAISEEHGQERLKNLASLNYKEIYIKPKRKTDFIISLNPDMAIEDKPENIKILNKAGIKVFYPDLSYTTGLESFGTKYKNWDHLYTLIENINNIK